MVNFFIPGIPAPQGSKTGRVINGRVVMWEASSKVKEWRKTVSEYAAQEMHDRRIEPLENAIEVVLIFQMPRGKSVMRKWHTVKPDIDKLIRSTLDGMTGIVYKDDAQVTAVSAVKEYATDKTGCQVLIVEEFDV